MAEQWTLNPLVLGSNPRGRTIVLVLGLIYLLLAGFMAGVWAWTWRHRTGLARFMLIRGIVVSSLGTVLFTAMAIRALV
jgi:hypothetical protein